MSALDRSNTGEVNVFHNLTGYLEALESAGDLVRMSHQLSPVHEVAAVLRQAHDTLGAAVLCEKVTGYDVPVAGNLFAKRKRLALAMGVSEQEIHEAYLRRRRQPIEPRLVADGPVQEVIIRENLDVLREMPILTHHRGDVGPYLTSALTVARDPETGERGVGLHRIQVQGPNRLGLFLASPPLSRFLAKAESRGQALEIAVVAGMDPVLCFAGVVWAPDGEDKFAIAGGLSEAPVSVTRAVSVDLEVPAEAEYVLEARLIPGERATEGPFGESSGYYMTFQNPVAEVLAITRRRKPVYHALVPFGPEEGVLLDLSWELDQLKALQSRFPSVKLVHMREMGMTAIVQLSKTADDEPGAIIEHLHGALTRTKQVIVVDDDIDVYRREQVDWAIATRCQPDRDVIVRPGLQGTALDPSASDVTVGGRQAMTTRLTAKLGVDATRPAGQAERYERVDVPPEARAQARKLIEGLRARLTP